jgi:hypothetical protein
VTAITEAAGGDEDAWGAEDADGEAWLDGAANEGVGVVGGVGEARAVSGGCREPVAEIARRKKTTAATVIIFPRRDSPLHHAAILGLIRKSSSLNDWDALGDGSMLRGRRGVRAIVEREV